MKKTTGWLIFAGVSLLLTGVVQLFALGVVIGLVMAGKSYKEATP